MRPCPFCGVQLYECSYDGGKTRWSHEANGCIISRKFVQGPDQETAWNNRAVPMRTPPLLEKQIAEVRRRVQAGELDLRDIGQQLIGFWDQDFPAALLDAAAAERPALRPKPPCNCGMSQCYCT